MDKIKSCCNYLAITIMLYYDQKQQTNIARLKFTFFIYHER